MGEAFSSIAEADEWHDSDDDESITLNQNEEVVDEKLVSDDYEYDKLFNDVSIGLVDVDEIMATEASKSKGVSREHLSKAWRISLKEADDTINVTSQNMIHCPDPKLARNYGTNNRMLRYKHIDEDFYMDTFFATKKGGKSSRGNVYC